MVIPTLADWLAPMVDMSANDLTERALSDGSPDPAPAVERYASVWNYAQGIAANESQPRRTA